MRHLFRFRAYNAETEAVDGVGGKRSMMQLERLERMMSDAEVVVNSESGMYASRRSGVWESDVEAVGSVGGMAAGAGGGVAAGLGVSRFLKANLVFGIFCLNLSTASSNELICYPPTSLEPTTSNDSQLTWLHNR